MRSLFVSLMAVLLCVPSVSEAQKKARKITITGYVTDQEKRPVAGAVIFIDKAKTEVTTDHKGYYSIRVNPGAKEILVFTLLNGAQEIQIDGRTSIDFILGAKAANIENNTPDKNEVNVGYGTMKKDNMTEGTGTIKVRESDVPYQTIYDMIKGKVAGVEVSGTSIKVMGSSSLNVSTEPLFVVDGIIVGTIENIDPQTVKSIEVLKGPAASVYGTKGSNGVILITRKTGKD